jgi:hypothetical protein
MNADAERHRAQAAIYIQIAKLMTNETSTGALRAKAENHISKAKAIEERERQITQAPSNCGSRRTIKHIRVASGVVRASAVKSAIQRVKDPDAERASIFDQAKAEALEKAKAAVAELNALGLSYTLTSGAGGQGKTSPTKEKRAIKAAACPICEFQTAPPHDGRTHRNQKKKGPFSAAELKEKGLVKV